MRTTYTCKKCKWHGLVNGVPRCLPCALAAVNRWRKKNPNKVKAQKARYDKKFRETRPEEYGAKRRKYYLPATAKRNWARRYQWLHSGTVSKTDLQDIFTLYDGKCAYCGVSVKPRFSPKDPRGFDHVTPRSKGGKHERKNIVVCCQRCNIRKRDN